LILLALLQAIVARPHVTISLVPEFTAVVAGMPQRMALRFEVEPGWHVYWRNPGESGVATTVTWTLPAGFTVDSLQYPTPSRLDVAGVVTHIIEGDVVFQSTIRPPPQARLTSHVSRLTAHVRYGVCKDVCYPGRATVSITMPVMTDAGPNAAWRIVDSLYDARRPRAEPLTAGMTFNGDIAVISVLLPPGCAGTSVTLYPWDRDVSPAAVTIPMPRGCGPAVFKLPLREKPRGLIRGVVVVGADRRGYQIANSN
jgi:DsbC/DsbD-like thiol-disulfide interchange protein